MARHKTDSNVVDMALWEPRAKRLEQLFHEHGAGLRSFLKMRVHSSVDVEDLTQEVFFRLARMPDLENRLSPHREDNRAFILTTANNLVVDRERRKAVRSRYMDDMETVEEDAECWEISPDVELEGVEEIKIVEQAIIELPTKWRHAFVLTRFKYLSYQEIADIMGVSTRTVENYIANALAKLRGAVSRATGEER